MGFFKDLFGSGEKETKGTEDPIPWIPLTSLDQLNEIEEKSHTKAQVIFKHSTTCGISRMVLNMFGRNLNALKHQMDFYFLDLHAYRQVSDEVGYRFQVLHQSPQILVIRNGITVAHDSHGAINELDLERFV
ncbi:bacillithiol system redox-active protein YtxJ [Ulvibacterium marinum]|uniref:bacillithiol system redox-active protein YtxJ n=1 Tax=Ulvibacterium marinum TaxID=2419782 RepID=UPI002494C0E0|nr:bacillithiol system redox-active protein YtxJ [Ulvibacterium marinum]